MRIVQDLQQRQQKTDLVCGKKVVTAADAANPMAAKRGQIGTRLARERTHQDHDVLRSDRTQLRLGGGDHRAVMQHCFNTGCDKFRLDLIASDRRVSRQRVHIHIVQLDRRRAHLRKAAARVESLRIAVVQPADLRRHRQAENRIRSRQDLRVRAEVVRQQDSRRFPLRRVFLVGVGIVFVKEDRRVRHAEAIDRLLHVADKEQISPVA